MPNPTIGEIIRGRPRYKCLGSDYMTTYGTAKPLVTTTASGTVQKQVPVGTRFVEFTVRAATLVISADGSTPSATIGNDYATGVYQRDWPETVLNNMQAFSAGAATLSITYWGLE
jgi:hypothetical protein